MFSWSSCSLFSFSHSKNVSNNQRETDLLSYFLKANEQRSRSSRTPASTHQHLPNRFTGSMLLILIETGPVQAIMTKP